MQINRLFEIIYILLDRGKVTAQELADKFEVSTRTIYRDVETLSGGKIPIYMSKGKSGGIFLHDDFVLNKAVLTEGEKSEILSGVRALNAVDRDGSSGAIQKLSALFGGNNADWVEVDFASWENKEEEKSAFLAIKSAILHKNVVRFCYFGAEGNGEERTVEPLKMCFKGQAWYLYGFCRLRQDFRFFKLRRIKDFAEKEERFDRIAPEKVLTAKAFEEETIDVVIQINKKMAYRVHDEFNKYRTLESGDFLIHLSIPKGDWFYGYISSFGPYAQVLEPLSIRDEVRRTLEKTIKNYM